MSDEVMEIIEKLKIASPLEAPKLLQQMELYDAKSSQDIIDEVYQQFATGENLKEEIVKPVFLSVVDGLLENTGMGKSARKKGLTAQRFINECEQFSYENYGINSMPDGYTETKNANDYITKFGEDNRPEFDRKKYENQNSMNAYKNKKVEENNGNKLLKDEYTGESNIYAYRKNPDARRNDPKYDYQAEPDHIVPLKQIHEQLKGNYGLSDEDIKRIANSEDNLALTSGQLNGKKKDSSNSDFIKKQEQLKKEGKPYVDLDDDTKKRMIDMEKDSQKKINDDANKAVLNNITGNGQADRQDRINAYKAEEERTGKKLTPEDRDRIDKKLAKDKQKKILGTSSKEALNEATDYAVGNLILYIVKPIYYEISDIFKAGMMQGVNASSNMEAIKIRFSRVKNYIIENAQSFLGDNIWSFVKGFISSLLEGIISLFTGMLKQVLKLVKEGIKVFVQSAKILFGKESKEMSLAEKGDAIIKLLGGSIIAISGIGIEALLNKIGIGEPWSIVLSTMLSGIASTIFMYILDKVDLFSVKAEKRRDRIVEVFQERINDINEAAEACNIVAIETLIRQRKEFDNITYNIKEGFTTNNIDSINEGLYKMAKFMNVDLEYTNTDEFCDYMDAEDALVF